jgi:hypothetical protein
LKGPQTIPAKNRIEDKAWENKREEEEKEDTEKL